MAFRSIGGSRIIGQGIPQPVPITLDPAPYLGALVYGQDGRVYASNGTAWVDVGSGAAGPQGVQGLDGIQGIQGTYGPGFTIIGSVADVDAGGDPQATLNTGFPSANIGEGVIDEADDELWIYVGSSVWVNIGSFRGVQGFQGVQGVQGTQGIIGDEGIQGSRGFRGFQGAQGMQGTTGIQGVQGIQGNQGTQGTTGLQGVQGNQGVQGPRNFQGVQGIQGPQGTTGIQGDTGIQGIAGDFGGLSYDFTYDNDTTDSDPGTGNVRFNNTNLAASGLIMYIDDEDDGGVQVTDGIMTELASVVGPVKGYMKIVNGANIYDQATFRIDSNVVDATGYWKVDVTRISGVTAFTNGTDFRISFVRNGEQGVQGIQGLQGTDGIQGVQGPRNFQGTQGIIGFQGIQGETGTQGVQGLQGLQGLQGTTGSQGVQGSRGLQGVQGDTGVQGVQGLIGIQGGSGLQGSQGTTGIQGATGIQGDRGFQGVQGFMGYNGGLSYLWNYNSSTTEGFPGLNSWLLNNTDVTAATRLYIDDLTDSGRRVDELFNYLDSFTSSPKGQIFIRTPKNPATGNYQFLIYEYTDWVWGVTGTGSDWGHFVVNLIERSELEGSDLSPGTSWTLGAVPTYGNQAVFEFIPAGQRGAQGIQGFQGIQGGPGFQGTQGIQGPQSIQGTTGIQGAQGIAGSYGGASFEYDYTPDVTAAAPATGIYKFDNADITLATTLRISQRDTFGSDIGVFLNTLDDSTSALKCYIKFISVANPAEYAIYGMTASTQVSGYFNMTVVHLSSSTNMDGTYLTNNTDTIVSFSVTGDRGLQGIQGTQGIQGVQGVQGLQGQTGAGTQGAQGVQGDFGFQGVQGFPGPIGPQGVQGPTGTQGTLGLQGSTGSFGGVTFDYTFSTNIAATDPGVGTLKFNNATLSSATNLYMDDRDDNFVDIQPFLRTIDDSTSPIKGHYKVSAKFNPAEFVIFSINSLTENAGYFTISSSYVSGSVAGTFADAEDVVITFARTGDIGPVGPQGTQGIQGNLGIQGISGSGNQGVQGIQGSGTQGVQGVQGISGQAGTQGTQGFQGFQGGAGSQGVAGGGGTQGAIGFQGVQGIQGFQGGTGGQGVQGIGGIGGAGIQGFQGPQGPQGAQGFQGTTGIQGDIGFQGISGSGNQGTQGPQGTIGADGFQGAQGVAGAGSQGTFGAQGPQGPQGLQGLDGDGNQGVQGFQGASGIGDAGIQGIQGLLGFQGIGGDAGTPGFQGAQGPNGFQGTQGISGGLGSTGLQGVQGIQGGPGFQGDFGPSGPQGAQGTTGIQGDVGIQGFPGAGAQGVQGIQGITGIQGFYGFQGTQGIQGFGNEGAVKNLQNVHTSNLQSTPLFITMVEGGATERPLIATLGPNPGGESNFFYTSDVDQLSIENLSLGGNITVGGTVTTGTITGLLNDIQLPNDTSLILGGSSALDLSYVSAGNGTIRFDMDGSQALTATFRDSSTLTDRFTFDMTNGNFTATGDVTTNSDERLKENIETVDNALIKVMNMRGVYFNKKDNPDLRKIGLIAQEVERVIPEAVTTEIEGDKIKSVSYGSLVGLLIEAIKDLKEELDQKGQ